MLTGYKGTSSLSTGYVYAYPTYAMNYKELLELVYLHLRESLPSEVLPATYEYYTAGAWGKDLVSLTMERCRTLRIHAPVENEVFFACIDSFGVRIDQSDNFCAQDPKFFDKIDKYIISWFRKERGLKK